MSALGPLAHSGKVLPLGRGLGNTPGLAGPLGKLGCSAEVGLQRLLERGAVLLPQVDCVVGFLSVSGIEAREIDGQI
jgi:hypothetical protein